MSSPATTEGAAYKTDHATLLTGWKAFLITAALIFAIISYQLNATMVAPALPHIASELEISIQDVSKVTSMFFLAGSISGVVATRWSDFVGRRNIVILVVSVAAAGSLLAVLTSSFPLLLVARVMQGVAAGAFQITYVILGQRLRATVFAIAVSVIAAINGGVAGIDGAIGGWLTENFGYHSIFEVICIIAVIAVVVVICFVPKDPPYMTEGRMDWWGAALMTAMLITVTYFVSSGTSAGWFKPMTLLYLGLFAVSVLLFIIVEQRIQRPLVRPRKLASRQVWPLLAVTILFTVAFSAVIYYTYNLFAQDKSVGFGMHPGLAALMFVTPAAAVAALVSPLTGWLTAKLGWTLMLRIGMLWSSGVIALLALFPENMWLAVIAMASLGISYKEMCIATVNGLGVLLSPKEEPGILPGLVGAAFGIGNGLGVTTVAAAVGTGTRAGFVGGLWISFSIAIVAFIVALLVPKPRVEVENKQTQAEPQ
jgi:MFS family permease